MTRIALGSALVVIFWTNVTLASLGQVGLNCQIELGAEHTRFTLRGRVSNDKNLDAHIVLPMTSNLDENHIVLEDPDINRYFSERIVFLGSAHIDPMTKERKLFLGIYSAYSEQLRNRSKFYNLPFVDFSTNYKRETIQTTGYGLPIASAVSDSGSITLFTGDYNRSRLKMKCQTEDYLNYMTKLDPSQPRHQFSCNINVKNNNFRQSIDEPNKPVIIGFSYNDRSQLQPIIEDEHLKSVMPAALIMGNLYINPENQQPELLLGLYRMSRFYDPVKHAGYYTPEYQPKTQDGRPYFFAMPLAEVRTQSDYAELRTAATTHGHSLKVECKKLNNKMTWLETANFNI